MPVIPHTADVTIDLADVTSHVGQRVLALLHAGGPITVRCDAAMAIPTQDGGRITIQITGHLLED